MNKLTLIAERTSTGWCGYLKGRFKRIEGIITTGRNLQELYDYMIRAANEYYTFSNAYGRNVDKRLKNFRITKILIK
jgi:hypothetical protein